MKHSQKKGMVSHKNPEVTNLLTCLACVAVAGVLCAGSVIAPQNVIFLVSRGFVDAVVAPFRMGATALKAPFVQARETDASVASNTSSEADLLAQIEELKSQNATLQEQANEAQDLRELLDFKNSSGFTTQACEVIERNMDSLNDSLTINAGVNAGISVGMAVLDQYGIVGQVMRVDVLSAEVRLITDERASVSALDQQTQALGQITGQGTNSLLFSYVSTSSSVNVGDVILSAGLGGAYPKDIPIGTVTSVDKAQGAQYYDITVAPSAHLLSAKELLVVTSTSQTENQG